MTVIIHGTGLERSDFAAMRAAPTIRTDGVGDGRGAKLVWSPLSNLLLYGETTDVYDALAEEVLVSLGTDWTPSGSRTLLQELKIADLALRDVRLLGSGREQISALSLDDKDGLERQRAENALDRTLVDMVTRNPALALRWYDKVGSVEAGKVADLLLVRRPSQSPALGQPPDRVPRLGRRDGAGSRARARRRRSACRGRRADVAAEADRLRSRRAAPPADSRKRWM